VRAENPIHGSDQQGCGPSRLTVMITGHVPAVRFSPDHADRLMAAEFGGWHVQGLSAVLGLVRWLGSGEELVHDLGAGGDDGS